MNNKIKVILPLVLVSSAAFVLFQVKNNSQSNINSTNKPTNNSSSNKSSKDQLNSTIQFQKLSVLSNRCIGCGKCVRIDSSHFEIQGNKAVVVSSQNLDSSNLKLAINNCPVGAIVLE